MFQDCDAGWTAGPATSRHPKGGPDFSAFTNTALQDANRCNLTRTWRIAGQSRDVQGGAILRAASRSLRLQHRCPLFLSPCYVASVLPLPLAISTRPGTRNSICYAYAKQSPERSRRRSPRPPVSQRAEPGRSNSPRPRVRRGRGIDIQRGRPSGLGTRSASTRSCRGAIPTDPLGRGVSKHRGSAHQGRRSTLTCQRCNTCWTRTPCPISSEGLVAGLRVVRPHLRPEALPSALSLPRNSGTERNVVVRYA